MASNDKNPDETIIRLLNSDDRKSISLIYKYHAAVLIKSITRLLGSSEDAEDIVQDLIITIWERRKEISLRAPMRNYLLVAVYNRAINHIKLKGRHSEFVADISDTDLAQIPDGIPNVNRKELSKHIHIAIMRIPGKARAVLLLSLFFKMSNKEIANHFGVTVKAVEKNITKAYRLLKILLHATK
jgi:RNA polymerase sigma-70 factor (ECF subfamily)